MNNHRHYQQIYARDGYCNWTSKLPRDHRNLYMTRPSRRQEKLNCRLIVTGHDADDLLWPLYHKPVEYYW